MSFGAGMAAGFGAGMGSGIAIGISSGTKQARDKLGQYFESREITLRDQLGKQIAIDDALDQALCCGDSKGRKIVIVSLALGLLFAAILGLAIYFLFAHG